MWPPHRWASCLWEDAGENRLSTETSSQSPCVRVSTFSFCWLSFPLHLFFCKHVFTCPINQVPYQALWIHRNKNTVKFLPNGAYILVGETNTQIDIITGIQNGLEISLLQSAGCMSSFLGNDEVRREAKNRLHQFSSPAPPSIHWVDLKESFTQLEPHFPYL